VDSDGVITNKVIRLEGEGLFPRLYFDKRELILPIVPLGWESSIKFKIKNEGYENEEINAEFESYPQGALPIKLIWNENNHNIGLMKNELKCEVKFMSLKPITFTTKLIFYDKEGKQFPIQVAGTTDNCIFTNYSFFQRSERDIYEFVSDKETHSLNLKKINIETNGNKNKEEEKEKEKDDLDDDKKSEKNSSSFAGSSVAKKFCWIIRV